MIIQERRVSMCSLGGGARRHLADGHSWKRASPCAGKKRLASLSPNGVAWMHPELLLPGKDKAGFQRKHIYSISLSLGIQEESYVVPDLYIFVIFIFLALFPILRRSISGPPPPPCIPDVTLNQI